MTGGRQGSRRPSGSAVTSKARAARRAYTAAVACVQGACAGGLIC